MGLNDLIRDVRTRIADGNARDLADDVVDAYADENGLSPQELSGLDLTADQRTALRSVLGEGPSFSTLLSSRMNHVRDGFVSTDERQTLRDAGFREAFITRLAGSDGTHALRQRASQLSGSAESFWYRPDESMATRRDYLLELGGIARRSVRGVHFNDTEAENPTLVNAVRDAARPNLLNIIRDSSENPEVRAAAVFALSNMGPSAADLRTIAGIDGFEQVAQASDQIAERLPAERRRAFFAQVRRVMPQNS